VTEAPSPFAVIHERLPYLDRRALSQAWISAFHLAAQTQAAQRVPVAHRSPNVRPAPLPSRIDVRPMSPRSAPGRLATVERTRSRHLAVVDPARGEHRVRARGASSGVARTAERSVQAQFTLVVDGTRVQILARRSGNRIDVVALCSARTADAVRRVLADPDRMLRVQGDRLAAHVRALPGDDA
jgi:glucose dehydrogenase